MIRTPLDFANNELTLRRIATRLRNIGAEVDPSVIWYLHFGPEFRSLNDCSRIVAIQPNW